MLSNNFFHTNFFSQFLLNLSNSNLYKISFFHARGLKLGHFDIFNMPFSISSIVTAYNFMKSRSRDSLAVKGSLRLVMCSQLLTYAFLGCFIILISTVTHTSVRPCQVLAHSKSTDSVIRHTFIFICVEINGGMRTVL